MKVRDAMDLITMLKTEKASRQSYIVGNVYHAEYEDHLDSIRRLSADIQTLQELIYNMELEDSYNDGELEWLEKYDKEM